MRNESLQETGLLWELYNTISQDLGKFTTERNSWRKFSGNSSLWFCASRSKWLSVLKRMGEILIRGLREEWNMHWQRWVDLLWGLTTEKGLKPWFINISVKVLSSNISCLRCVEHTSSLSGSKECSDANIELKLAYGYCSRSWINS